MGYVRFMTSNERGDDGPELMAGDAGARPVRMTAADRWDRRFRIEGDAHEALKVVVADRAEKES